MKLNFIYSLALHARQVPVSRHLSAAIRSGIRFYDLGCTRSPAGLLVTRCILLSGATLVQEASNFAVTGFTASLCLSLSPGKHFFLGGEW